MMAAVSPFLPGRMNAKRRLWFHLAMARSLIVGICPAVGFGAIRDPVFGVSAVWTSVSPILNLGVALEGRCAPQLHRS
jgi:hypothetical protein